MDTSKEYIKMCEKAEEIQKIFYNDREFSPMDFMKWVKKPLGKVVIWLPRQDQLQEMLGYSKNDSYLFILTHDFYSFCGALYAGRNRIAFKYFDSMEQLWLAFVMKGKYNKIWNGENWVT